MKILYIIEESVQSLQSNILRSSLTIIGIVVGIFSVTAMLALGQGLSTNILDRLSSFSSGDITVSGMTTQADLEWIKNQGYVASALGTKNINGVTTIVTESSFSPSVKVVLGDYDKVIGLKLVSGEAFDFNDANYDKHAALVDEGFVDAVKTENGTDISSGIISLNGQTFTVIGVVEGGSGGFGRRTDGSIIVPYKAALGILTNTSEFSSIGVNLIDQQYYDIGAKHILEALNTSRYAAKDSEDYFSVTTAQEVIKSAMETTSMISLFLGIVGGIALFVGGIGTMNMMLTTVTERTKEIGLRKAVGARNKDILIQILVESILLTTIGGAIGILLTYGASLLANQVLTADSMISVVMSGSVVLYATLVAIAVGVIFGLYPARNASKLQPVEALRSE